MSCHVNDCDPRWPYPKVYRISTSIISLPHPIHAMHIPIFFHLRAWALSPGNSDFGPWSNKDMDPVPPSQRTWTAWNFIAYWISDATHVAMWQSASSMLAIGLTWYGVPSALMYILHIAQATSSGCHHSWLLPYSCMYHEYTSCPTFYLTFPKDCDDSQWN